MTSRRVASPIASNSGTRLSLILASESPRRRALLAQAGVVPDAIIAADVDERVHRGELPRVYGLRVAQAKAEAVAAACQDRRALILAADTVVACGRRILPKAASDEDVRRCLRLLNGRAHQVLTAVALHTPDGKMRSRSVMTHISFARLSEAEIEAFVESREGIRKAGGYAIQGRAEGFVRRINGSYSNVVGLPLFQTIQLLRGCGFPVP
jgi:septum formation protein